MQKPAKPTGSTYQLQRWQQCNISEWRIAFCIVLLWLMSQKKWYPHIFIPKLPFFCWKKKFPKKNAFCSKPNYACVEALSNISSCIRLQRRAYWTSSLTQATNLDYLPSATIAQKIYFLSILRDIFVGGGYVVDWSLKRFNYQQETMNQSILPLWPLWSNLK